MLVCRAITLLKNCFKSRSDYPARALSTASPRIALKSIQTFSKPEIEAMVKAAHQLDVKVASHCVNPETIKMLIEAGVDTLEHASNMTEELLPLLKEKGVVWNPTVAAYFSFEYPGSRRWDALKEVFLKAMDMGVRVGTGGDTDKCIFIHSTINIPVISLPSLHCLNSSPLPLMEITSCSTLYFPFRFHSSPTSNFVIALNFDTILTLLYASFLMETTR
jgi:hypothetical protein